MRALHKALEIGINFLQRSVNLPKMENLRFCLLFYFIFFLNFCLPAYLLITSVSKGCILSLT